MEKEQHDSRVERFLWYEWGHIRISGWGGNPIKGYFLHLYYNFYQLTHVVWAFFTTVIHAFFPWFMPYWAERSVMISAIGIEDRQRIRRELNDKERRQ